MLHHYKHIILVVLDIAAPIVAGVFGVWLADVHLVLGCIVLLLTGVYTAVKIYKELKK